MYTQIFNPDQVQLLPLVQQFKKEFYLVGGTAIALHIGHRRSIDFDLFKFSPIKPKNIIQTISDFGVPCIVTRRVTEQLNATIIILKTHFSIQQISDRTTELFGQLFSEKLFRAQLSYFDDIDYTEPVEFIATAVPDDEIKEFLTDKATDLF